MGWTQVKYNTPSDPWRRSLLEDWTKVDRDEVMGLLRQKVHHTCRDHTANAIGSLALKLRKHFCGSEERTSSLTSPPLSPIGEICVMRRPDVVARFFPAYAALSPGSLASPFMQAFWRNEF